MRTQPPLRVSNPLDSRWTREIRDEEARKNFELIVRNSTLLLTRLKGILEEAERSLISQSATMDDFKDPNWSHKQAFRNGELGCIRKMKDLIPF